MEYGLKSHVQNVEIMNIELNGQSAYFGERSYIIAVAYLAIEPSLF